MKRTEPVTCLLVDVGGVLLTNGWDHHARKRAATKFDLDWAEMEERHGLNFETFEIGKISLPVYLDRVVFHKQRSFTKSDFKQFMFAQSKPFADMIELVCRLKQLYGLKAGIVNNESREINEYRVTKYKLDKLADFFISSCFVHLRKPDKDIFRLAIDIAQVPASRIIYIDNTALFSDIVHDFGMRSIVHSDYATTRNALAAFGLQCGK